MPQPTSITSPLDRAFTRTHVAITQRGTRVDIATKTNAIADPRHADELAILKVLTPEAFDMTDNYRHQADGAATDFNDTDVS